MLGHAVEDGVGAEAQDTGAQAERRAVHRLGDTFREHRRLHRGVDTGDAGERLDEARDGPEQTGERREVPQHGQVARALFDLRQLLESLFVHALLHVVLGATSAAQTGRDDARDRRRARLAGVESTLDVSRDDLRLEQRHQLLNIDLRLRDVEPAVQRDPERERQQREDGPHAPAALLKVLHDEHESFSLWWWSSVKVWGGRGLPVHCGFRLEQQVRNVLADLGDIVERVLRLAVEVGEGGEADDAGEQTERGAVHRFGDALRQQRRFLRGVDTGDAGERLDETGDGAEQAGQGRQVAEHGQVARALLELRQLAEPRLFHGGGDLFVGPVGAHQARLNDAGQRRRVARAHLDRALDVAGGDLRTEKSHQLFLVDDGAAQKY